MGAGNFLQKLEAQLAPAPASAKQLAAATLWLMFVFISDTRMRGGTKRLQIKRVWEWSGERHSRPPSPKLARCSRRE
jgi:hypothetical protein